jgi:hypothetical protein
VAFCPPNRVEGDVPGLADRRQRLAETTIYVDEYVLDSSEVRCDLKNIAWKDPLDDGLRGIIASDRSAAKQIE